jgi:hypothetical protein
MLLFVTSLKNINEGFIFYSLRSHPPSPKRGVGGGDGNKKYSFWRAFLQINQCFSLFLPTNSDKEPIILVNKSNISTKKTSVEYAHQAHANTGFFLALIWLRAIDLILRNK